MLRRLHPLSLTEARTKPNHHIQALALGEKAHGIAGDGYQPGHHLRQPLKLTHPSRKADGDGLFAGAIANCLDAC